MVSLVAVLLPVITHCRQAAKHGKHPTLLRHEAATLNCGSADMWLQSAVSWWHLSVLSLAARYITSCGMFAEDCANVPLTDAMCFHVIQSI